MGIKSYEKIVLDELIRTLDLVNEEDCDEALKLLQNAKKIFVLGLGK